MKTISSYLTKLLTIYLLVLTVNYLIAEDKTLTFFLTQYLRKKKKFRFRRIMEMKAIKFK